MLLRLTGRHKQTPDKETPTVAVEGYSRMKPESVRGGSRRRSPIAGTTATKTKASPDGEAFFG